MGPLLYLILQLKKPKFYRRQSGFGPPPRARPCSRTARSPPLFLRITRVPPPPYPGHPTSPPLSAACAAATLPRPPDLASPTGGLRRRRPTPARRRPLGPPPHPSPMGNGGMAPEAGTWELPEGRTAAAVTGPAADAPKRRARRAAPGLLPHQGLAYMETEGGPRRGRAHELHAAPARNPLTSGGPSWGRRRLAAVVEPLAPARAS
jgi:hypothetical protein